MKILISAYACSPYRGSESGVGWGFVHALAAKHDLCVITDLFFKEEITRYQAEHPELNARVRFEYVPRVQHKFIELLWPPAYYWTYRRWHQNAYRLALKLHSQEGFELAHQLTMVGFREPGYLWKLGIPFVWGPVGGMGFFPWRFFPLIGRYGTLYYVAYNAFNWFHMNFLPRPRKAARAAGTGLITVTPENRDGARKYWDCDSTVLAEVGLPRAPVSIPRLRVSGEPLLLVWTGQHTPGKALNLALLALSRLPGDICWELHVLGKGAQTDHWKRLAGQLGIGGHCRFHGWLPRNQALEVMHQAHVMLITSLRDLTATVTVEALALGLPIICLDHCGFSEAVDETCGIKVPVTTPTETIHALALAIEQLAGDEEKRRKLAQGALTRATMYRWEVKAEVIEHIYRRKVTRRNGIDGLAL